jgi:hypothetical protein
VYVSKDDLSIQEFPLSVPDYAEEINKEIDTLVSNWKEQKLPPAQPRAYGVDKKTGKGKDCNYCSWKTLCVETEKK